MIDALYRAWFRAVRRQCASRAARTVDDAVRRVEEAARTVDTELDNADRARYGPGLEHAGVVLRGIRDALAKNA